MIYESNTVEVTKEGQVRVKSIDLTFTGLEAVAAHSVIAGYLSATEEVNNGAITYIHKSHLDTNKNGEQQLRATIHVKNSEFTATEPCEIFGLRLRADLLKEQVIAKAGELQSLAKCIREAQQGGVLVVEDTKARKLITESEQRLNASITRINEHYAREHSHMHEMLGDVWAALRKVGWKPDGEAECETVE